MLICACATVLITYGYVIGLGTDLRGEHLWLVDLLRTWLTRPLGLGEDFGPFGVMLLLAAAGYALASGARVLQLLMPLLPATVVAFALAGRGAWTLPDGASAGPLDLIGNLTLISQLVPGATLLLPLGWVTLLALLGGLGVLVTNRIAQRWRWTGYLAQLVIAVDVVALADVFSGLQRAGTVAAFFPLVVIGQVIHAVRSGAVSARVGTLLALCAYAVVAVADRTVPALADWWYPVAATYAGLLFTVAMVFAGRTAASLAASPIIRWAADRSWWFLAFIGAVGHPLLDAFADVLPSWLAAVFAVLGTVIAVEFGFRVSERIAALARRRDAV